MGATRQGLVERLLGRMNLRFPGLFALFLGLLLADFVIPDVIPFLDEILLALLATLFGLWKRRSRVTESPK